MSPMDNSSEKEYLHKKIKRLETELIQTQASLKSARADFNMLFDNQMVGILIVDDERNIIKANKKIARIFGYPEHDPGQLNGKSIREIHLSDAHYEKFGPIYASGLLNNEFYHIEYPFKKTDGSEIWCEISGKALDPNDAAKGILWIIDDITERKNAHEALLRSEEDLRATFASMDDLVFSLDADNRLIAFYQPSNTSDYIQFDPEQVINRKLDDLFPVMAGKLKPSMESARSRNKSVQTAFTLKLNNTPKHIWASICPKIINDRFSGFIIVERDITPFKEAKDKLEESERKFRKIINLTEAAIIEADDSEMMNSINRLKSEGVVDFKKYMDEHPDYIWELAQKIKILNVNDVTYKLFGSKDVSQLRDLLLANFTIPNLEMFKESMVAMAMGEKSYECEAIATNLRGEKINILFRRTIPEKTDEFKNVLFTLVDITKLKQAEEALSKALKEQQSYIDAIPDIFYVFDRNHHLIKWNKSAEELISYDCDEAEHQTGCVFFPEKAGRLHSIYNTPADFDKDTINNFEGELPGKDGQYIPFEFISAPLTDENNKFQGMVGIGRDITERKNHEKALRQAMEAAEVANRAKSEFLANMSHEIRTPLNAILGFTDLLISQVTDPRQKGYLESVRSSGHNLLTLINDILDLSKIEAGKVELRFEPVNPHDIFMEIQNIFSLKISEKGLEFIIDISPEIPGSLILDEVRLRQILFNLIGNAIKFTDKGFIKISVTKHYQQKDQSSLNLIFSVEDSGIGIPPDSHQVIFDAFRQQNGHSDKKYGGTGLGLSITKRLVEMMGGSISLKSEPGKGSIFEIVLKNVAVGAVSAASKKQKAVDVERVVFGPATILVVDDIGVNRELIKEFFCDTHIRMLEAENGKEGFSVVCEQKPDLVLMDIRMPVMDGFEATRMIKADNHTKDIPVIALTASGMKDQQKNFWDTGFDGILIKPVSRPELFAELIRHLPYERLPSNKSIEASERLSPDALNQLSAGQLSGIIDHLEGELHGKWQSATSHYDFEFVRQFGETMKSFGRQTGIDMITQFGESLTSSADSFDLENMNKTLNKYPGLISQLKTICDHSAGRTA